MINFGSYQREFLITNKLGTYSSANFLYGNTRKYHSLLACTQGHLNRINVLNRVLDRIETNQGDFPLSTNAYQNYHFDPEGFRNIANFELEPLPKWLFRVPGISIEKTIMLLAEDDTLLIKYNINSSTAGKLFLSPLINIRDIHENGNKETFTKYRLLSLENYANVTSEQNLSLHFTADNARFIQKPDTYFHIFYPDEEQRGYDPYEDLFMPGSFESNFMAGETNHYFAFRFNAKPEEAKIEDIWQIELEKLIPVIAPLRSGLESQLLSQSNKVKITTTKHTGIIAGYHWFDEWARDTFISLHGLALSQKDFDFAKKIFLEWGKSFQDGMLPNRLFINKIMNSVDGMFWFVIRLYEYTQLTSDYDTAKSLLPEIEEIYTSILQGKNKLHITDDGFLYDESANEARTWMDALVDGQPVTNRSGCAVEIQALWYNYIRILIILKEKFEDRTHLNQLKDLKVRIEKNFEENYWNNSSNCLYDVINTDKIDKSIRPNQIIPLYLPFKILSSKRSKMILATIELKLLTEVGLRTLSRDDEKYIGDYTGNQKQRDFSYHQGTIWTYLLGFYLISYLKTYNFSSSSVKYVEEKLKSFAESIQSKNLKYVPEIFSADLVEPNGCLLQAWSVATLLETIYYLKINQNNNVN
ncbi:glycogen debranching enzyme family protein [Candidatus Dojkabacteria bacterium]|uniref:Glycogen debranching enzyme family protein n=1 Tax=Candidatus Dojkabacteria bacterium TaxID=2099670 RepID=A0A955IBS3_9BACT|nr:glycogen debranching enzyme family protein [Candidatus Dojkabacteria bacterium]